ncbi:Tat pathway signal protein [Humitalea sp. 24SJ18S-53]|uniref:Tat pathway signal protein n=1 Tax=Humitalea sp. 24SJ18S-53 TaxID=3422307 RepID=UPI003D676826
MMRFALPSFLCRRPGILLAALVLATAALPAAAQQAPAIGLELNRLEPQQNGCRAWLMLRNPGETALETLRLDLVLFGRDGVVNRRLAVEAGPLPAAKTMARVFDVPGLACDGIGALLLNDLLACGSDPAMRAGCVERIATTSRVADVTFNK